MKTSAKWISGNNYILNNSKHLNIAISDPTRREENYDINCLDLVLMGFAGCVTAEFKKEIIKHRILLTGLETDVEIETLQESHPRFYLHVICRVKSNAKFSFLEECLDRAIGSSFLGILFKKAGIQISDEIILKTPAHYTESFAG